eukprot:gene10357-1876_t
MEAAAADRMTDGLVHGPWVPPKPNPTKCWYEYGGTKPCWGGGVGGNTSATALTFGTGLSGGSFAPDEKTIFAHQIAPGHSGVMNHFWSTCNAECEGALLVRYYVDGELNASIAYEPGMASGTGFDDPAAPWGTKWFGHGAHSAWFNNFKIPFGSSIRVTVQSTDGKEHSGFYMIVRGGLDIALVIGGVELPTTARLQLQSFSGPLQTLEVLNLVHVPEGSKGFVFLVALSVNNSGHLHHPNPKGFLEGCPHMFDPPSQAWPGTLLGSGTEDYFDSGWYFNAGEFHLPVAGYTHILDKDDALEWSAYRFHEMDPLIFNNGVRVTWRCGENGSPAPDGGNKCYIQPQQDDLPPSEEATLCEHVQSYGWVYTWPAAAAKDTNLTYARVSDSLGVGSEQTVHGFAGPPTPWVPPKPDPTKCWYEYGGTKPCWDADNSSSTTPDSMTFGASCPGCTFAPWEKTIFAHQIAPGHSGVMNHFWSTCNAECEGALLVRYYVDGELNASIAYEPGMASGTGFDDPAAPWGTKWFGHGAHSAWFNNFKIPFGSSIRVTVQSTDGKEHSGFYMIVRGGLDQPLTIGGQTLPPTARLHLQRYDGPLNDLEVLDVVSVPESYQGMVFLITLAVNNSGHGVTFLEGCPHMFDPPRQAWPGTLLGSGTEDNFDSGCDFNAGEFQLPVAGFTTLVDQKDNLMECSACQLQVKGHLIFNHGGRVTWRCGENGSPAPDGGNKCYIQPRQDDEGQVNLCEFVRSYGWVYSWPKSNSSAAVPVPSRVQGPPLVKPSKLRGGADAYYLGTQGATCRETCSGQSLHCSWQVGIQCNKTAQEGKWWAPDQPSYVSDPKDANYGDCLGYKHVPE